MFKSAVSLIWCVI